jgi:hypothetical protein
MTIWVVADEGAVGELDVRVRRLAACRSSAANLSVETRAA